LLPFKHYVAAEIEGVLRYLFDGGKLIKSPSLADESTLRRWWKEFRHKLPQWAGYLEARIFQLSHCALGFDPLFSDPLNWLEEALAKLPALPSEWPVLVKNRPTK
jgi:hypothetical protein